VTDDEDFEPARARFFGIALLTQDVAVQSVWPFFIAVGKE
jgi:hypothetical protein